MPAKKKNFCRTCGISLFNFSPHKKYCNPCLAARIKAYTIKRRALTRGGPSRNELRDKFINDLIQKINDNKLHYFKINTLKIARETGKANSTIFGWKNRILEGLKW